MVAIKKHSKYTISELERLVRHHNHLYFVEKNPEISDYEFDLLVEELRRRKPDSKVLHEIGSDLSDGSIKVRHEIKMLSLDKAYDLETMENWASKFSGKIVVSPKVDGCAVSIKYDDKGKLSVAATRGSGSEGELITENIRAVKSIPLRVSAASVEVRGEVYMALSVFKKYSGEFANPRNLAAGAIKQKDPKKTAEYNISFWAYDVVGLDVSTESEKFAFLKKQGFSTLDWKLIDSKNIQNSFDDFFQRREEYDFETDGVVFKVNDISEQKRLGNTAHHPRYAIAYKFQGDSGETILRDIEWSVSRTGVITPVGIVDPVELSGATVTRASLHNYGMVGKLGLKKGARVLMTRRGGVIPNIEKMISGGRGEFEAPLKCPSCGAATKVREDFLYCTDKKGCARTKISSLEHFIKTIECDGFGEKLIEQLYNNQIVIEPHDFYELTKGDLLRLERMGDVLAEKLIRNINAKREIPLDVFLRSLGIRELGHHASEILARKYGTLDKIMEVSEEEIASIHTFGEIIAGDVVNGFKEKKKEISALLKEVKVGSFAPAPEGRLSGKRFLFTGSMVAMERKGAEKLVKENGGVAATSISKDIDFLVVGSGGGAGSKLDKANKLIEKGAGIKIIDEDDFLKMMK